MSTIRQSSPVSLGKASPSSLLAGANLEGGAVLGEGATVRFVTRDNCTVTAITKWYWGREQLSRDIDTTSLPSINGNG